MYDEWIDDYNWGDPCAEFVGECTCLHDWDDHGWGDCGMLDNLGNECPCGAGWEE